METNEVWLRFTKGDKPVTPLPGYLKLASSEAASIKLARPFLVSWWFRGLKEADAVYTGPCHLTKGFLLERGTEVFWWCQW
jgi:hypothetical protein